MDGIAETAAIGYGVGNGQIECERGHHAEEEEDQPRRGLAVRPEQQMNTQQKLDHREGYREEQSERREKLEVKCSEIVFKLIGGTVWVDGFYKARKDERPPDNQTGEKNKPLYQKGFAFLVNRLALHTLSL